MSMFEKGPIPIPEFKVDRRHAPICVTPPLSSIGFSAAEAPKARRIEHTDLGTETSGRDGALDVGMTPPARPSQPSPEDS